MIDRMEILAKSIRATDGIGYERGMAGDYISEAKYENWKMLLAIDVALAEVEAEKRQRTFEP